MARIIAEAGIQIEPETTGFASELRGDLTRDMAAATAGLDKTVQLRVVTDVAAAEKQIRAGIANVQRVAEQLVARIQARTTALITKLQEQTVKLAAKIREQVQKLRDKINLLLQPFWAKLRASMNAVAAGWRRISDAAARAAEQVRVRFNTALAAVAAGWRVVSDGAAAAARRVADVFEPHLDRVRDGLALLRGFGEQTFNAIADAAARAMVRIRRGWALQNLPLRVLRAYGVATFRIIGGAVVRELTPPLRAVRNAGVTAFRAVQAAGQEAAERVARGFRTVGDAGSRAFTRVGTAARSAFRESLNALGRFRDGFLSAEAAASRFSGRLGTLGGVARKAFTGIQRDLRNLQTVVERSGRGFQRLGERVERSGKLGRVAGGLFSGVGKIMEGLSGTAGSLTGALQLVGSGFLDIGKSVLSATGSIVKFSAIAIAGGAILGAITFAVGAAGAAFAGLPALVGAAAASFAVFKLGMDGIKAAYENGLKPALDKLKTQISDVFERTLTPAFQRLGNELIPQVTGQMKNLAQAFADGGVRIIDMVNQADNIKKIQALIDNTTSAVRDQLVPALQNIIQSFIDIGANSSVLRDMVGIFTDLTNKTADWLSEMNRTGETARAVSNLRSVLSSLEDLFFRLVTAAVQFFDEATPGMESLLDSIQPNEDIMRRLGAAFGDTARAAGDFIRAIPPGAWDSLTASAESFADSLGKIANHPELPAFLQNLADIINGLSTAFGVITDVVGGVASAFGAVTDAGDGFLDSLRNLTGGVPPAETQQQALQRVMRETGASADEAARQVGLLPPPIENVASAAENSGQRIQDGFMSPIAGLAGQAGSALAPLPAAVEPPFNGAAVAAQVGAEKAKAAAEAGFGGIPPAAGAAINPLPGAVTPPVDAAAAAVKAGADKAAADAQAGFRPIPPDAQAALAGLGPAVQGAMDAAAAAAESGSARVRDSVQRGFDAAAQAASATMPRVADAVRAAMDAAAQAADAGGRRIGDAVRAGAQAAADSAQAAMPRVSEAVRIAMDQAGQFADTGGRRISDSVRNGAQQAADAAQAAMPRISEAVRTAMDQAAQAAEDGGRRIADGLRSSTEQAAAAAEAGMQRIVTTITAGMAQATAAATQGGQQIQQALQTALERTVQITVQSWQRIVAAFQAGGQQAVSIARSTGQQIVSTFQALAGPMFSAGFQIISRLAAGMIAAQGAAFAAASSTAAGIAARFPRSPAKTGPLSGAGDPLRSGGVIVERLAAGMTAQSAAVQAALQPILAGLVTRVNSVSATPTLSLPGSAGTPRVGGRDQGPSLTDFVRAATTTSAADSGLLGELKAQTALLAALRGDVTAGGYSANMLERLDKLIDAVSGGGLSAGQRAQAMRDLADLGAF